MKKNPEEIMESLALHPVNMNTEQLVNSINITEGPVTNMSLAISNHTRTPYSDATKVNNKVRSVTVKPRRVVGKCYHLILIRSLVV